MKKGDIVFTNDEIRNYTSRIRPGIRAKVIGTSQGDLNWTVVRLEVNGEPARFETTLPNYAISPPTVLDRLTEI